MDSTPAVTVENVGRMYHMYERPQDRLKQAFLWGRRRLYREFWALRNVSFAVRSGEAFGIIGRNGSGKSTLLQIIAGTLRPSEGSVRVGGRSAALLELGSGFHPQFTGRENVYVNGAILGLSRAQIERKLPEIEAFAEIGEFIDQPLTTYSSGMVVRLAFAVQVTVEPEVLIVDEALSVGDIFFQQKCFAKIREILGRGTTLLLVSHDLSVVQNLCDRVLLLDSGRKIFQGESPEAIARYYEMVGAGLVSTPGEDPGPAAAPSPAVRDRIAVLKARSILDPASPTRRGPRGLELVAARVVDEHGRDTRSVEMCRRLAFELLIHANEEVGRPNVGVELFNRFGTLVFATGALQRGHVLPTVKPGHDLVVRFEIELSIEPGDYTFAVSAAMTPASGNPNLGIFQDRYDGLGPLTVHYPGERLFPFYGVANLPTSITSQVVRSEAVSEAE
jgi:ABC-type polysaccharide/polyol phosphate transport system ATPase subunit